MTKEQKVKENIAKLPMRAYCDDFHEGVAEVHRGVEGYLPIDKRAYLLNNETAEQFIERKNKQLNVTKAEATALVVGSMFGFHVPGANVENYNEDGTLKTKIK